MWRLKRIKSSGLKKVTSSNENIWTHFFCIGLLFSHDDFIFPWKHFYTKPFSHFLVRMSNPIVVEYIEIACNFCIISSIFQQEIELTTFMHLFFLKWPMKLLSNIYTFVQKFATHIEYSLQYSLSLIKLSNVLRSPSKMK